MHGLVQLSEWLTCVHNSRTLGLIVAETPPRTWMPASVWPSSVASCWAALVGCAVSDVVIVWDTYTHAAQC